MKLFKYQQWHVLMLMLLLGVLYFYTKINIDILNGSLWGIATINWYILAITTPIFHQLYVLICWRLELHYKSISTTCKKYGFVIFKVGFKILIVSRLITIILLAVSNSKTITMHPIVLYGVSIVFAILAGYLFYSVFRYFGIDNAYGRDHFYPEEARQGSLVRKGIFKYTSNGMYVFGFLTLWIPGIVWGSKAALAVALFSHIYIWVHYYCTELPDIKVIYK